MHRRTGPVEIIDVDASPVISVVSKPSPEPAQRRGQGTHATQIPRIPEFKLGYAEKERQIVDQRVADRKQKTGYNHPPTTVHFAVSVAHFHWDDFEDGEGDSTLAFFLPFVLIGTDFIRPKIELSMRKHTWTMNCVLSGVATSSSCSKNPILE
jgi:hypothetical protein